MSLWKHTFVNNSINRGKTIKHLKRCMSSVKKIDKLLIANRGEIACRIMRTARRMGIETVAVYSDADKNALHVSMANEAYNIGPPSAQKSYLLGHKILEVAKKSNSQAIHPGYGFLSENTEFAELCQKENVIFVGPSAEAIRNMGIKSTSKSIMSAAGVPIIEGYHDEDQSVERLQKEARQIGYPIMIKAVRGGGGKGMRIAFTESEFLSALESAKNESLKSFNDDNVLLERYIGEPRHVEVQVFGDQHGQYVYLFERDCSVQRRHQKIIEEAPAPGISEKLRAELGNAAVRAAKAVNYVGAGTVEFIMDKNTHSFHFMEMNTRLQVEHPITEMITGTDLVEWQLKVASGEKLPLTQDQIILNGHAFEGRIYAEDPAENFLPRSGPLLYLKTPQPSANVRVETGVRENDEVTVHYDPMIAKLVVWGKNRSEALTAFASNLAKYNIAGVETNINFLLDLCHHPEFEKGNVYTAFIEDNKFSLFPKRVLPKETLIQLAVSVVTHENLLVRNKAKLEQQLNNPFVIERGFRINHNLIREMKFTHNGEPVEILLRTLEPDLYEVNLDKTGNNWILVKVDVNSKDEQVLSIKYPNEGENKINECKFAVLENCIHIFEKKHHWQFLMDVPNYSDENLNSTTDNKNTATAPMPGIIEKINVAIGDVVKEGDPLFILIAMKMEYVVKATGSRKITKILSKIGDSVSKNAVIIQFDDQNEITKTDV